MKTIDLSLFEGEGFEIKTKHSGNPEGKDYVINFVSAQMEHSLMNEQENIIEKSKNWKNIDGNDLQRWKAIIKKIIKENDSTFDETDVNKLFPMHVIGILMALMTYLNERSKIIFP